MRWFGFGLEEEKWADRNGINSYPIKDILRTLDAMSWVKVRHVCILIYDTLDV